MADWVCPWDICNHQQAQECRANTGMYRRGAAGCGGRFTADTTPEQAKEIVRPPRSVIASNDAQDARRYRQLRKGLPLTVVIPAPTADKPDKKVTVIYGPNPEAAWGESLDRAVDAACGVLGTQAPASLDPALREFMGRMVRMEWERWAREQPSPKPSWLTPWDQLTEPEREVDRRIAEAIWRFNAVPTNGVMASDGSKA